MSIRLGDTLLAGIPASSEELPSQTGQSGKFLTTNGTNASWSIVDILPSQSGQSGKFLSTNGSTASWETLTGGSTITYWDD